MFSIPVVLLGTITDGNALRSIRGILLIFDWTLGIGLRTWILDRAPGLLRLLSLQAVRP
jgi:hypothetical protein